METNGERNENECNKKLLKALKNSKVNYLLDSFPSMDETFIQCGKCGNESLIGGFQPPTSSESDRKGKILLCEDNIEKYNINDSHVKRTVLHELVHAYDNYRIDLDWRNCFHIACSEIRAANLSGDCGYFVEGKRNFIKWNQGKNEDKNLEEKKYWMRGRGRDCLKRRVKLSLEVHEQCKEKADFFINSQYIRLGEKPDFNIFE
eukprot:snap_masked-scaffold_37-processed-gene-1.4-mRNA-1 protein AED:0.09 eAED:0.14 QI:0/0/0/0.25/1/1/4/0/203